VGANSTSPRKYWVNPRRGDLSTARARTRDECIDAATSLDTDRGLDDALVARQAERIAELEVQNERLREALSTRDLIWSAKVLIAAATGCGPDEAHALLIKQSQHENRKVREIAAEIVARS